MADMITSTATSTVKSAIAMFWSRLNKKYAEKLLEQGGLTKVTLQAIYTCNNGNALRVLLLLENKSPAHSIVISNFHLKATVDDCPYQGAHNGSLSIEPLTEIHFEYLIPTGPINKTQGALVQVESYEFDLSLGCTSKHEHEFVHTHTHWKIELK